MAKKTKKTAPQSREPASIKSFLDMIAPSVVKFEPDHFICGNTFRCVWALREYPTQTDEQATMDNDNIHSAYRGDIFYADLEPVRGSEQGGVRPVLIIQNDIGNRHSPTVIVAAITSRIKHHRLPTHVNLNGRQCGLHNESTIMLEQLRTLDKQRLLGYAGTVGKGKMQEVNAALEISIGIKDILPDNKRKRGSDYGKSEHREEKHQADPDDH